MKNLESGELTLQLTYVGRTEIDGKNLAFVIWPEYTNQNRQIEQVAASAFIIQTLSPDRAGSVTRTLIEVNGLNVERPVAVAVHDPEKGWRVTSPEEFPQEETTLRRSFAQYLKDEFSAR